MKTREYFVSNSSSMSFIVTSKNSFNVARKILLMLKVNYLNEEDTDYDEDKEYFEMLENNLKKHIKENIPYLIENTTNYETWVFPSVNDKVKIYSCNNESELWTEFIGYQYGDDDYWSDESDETKETLKFYNINRDIFETYNEFNEREYGDGS